MNFCLLLLSANCTTPYRFENIIVVIIFIKSGLYKYPQCSKVPSNFKFSVSCEPFLAPSTPRGSSPLEVRPTALRAKDIRSEIFSGEEAPGLAAPQVCVHTETTL